MAKPICNRLGILTVFSRVGYKYVVAFSKLLSELELEIFKAVERLLRQDKREHTRCDAYDGDEYENDRVGVAHLHVTKAENTGSHNDKQVSPPNEQCGPFFAL